MKDDMTQLEHFPEPNEENIKAAARRREKYSLSRDLMMQENNEAISRRLAKEKEKESKSDDSSQADTENTKKKAE